MIGNTRRPSGEVYGDREPWCPLCACQEHQPRFRVGCDHGTRATALTGGARRRPQPELSRAVPSWLLQQHAARPRKAVPVNAPRQHPRQPVASGARPWAVPGAHGPRAGVTVPGVGNPVGRGHPARLWPPSPQLAGHADIRQAAAVSAGSASIAPERVRTEVPSGLAPRTSGGGRCRYPDARRRRPAHPWQAADVLGCQRQ